MNHTIIRAAVQELLTSAAQATDLAAQLHNFVTGETEIDHSAPSVQPSAAAPAAKRCTPRRGRAPKAGRKGKVGRLTVKVAIDGKKLADAVTLKAAPVKPNGHDVILDELHAHKDRALATPAPIPPVKAEAERTPTGKIVKGSLDLPVIRHITAHPGMRCPELARVFSQKPDAFRHLLNRLVAEGRIVRLGSGYLVEAEPVN